LTSPTKPVWLLDIDGVLNATHRYFPTHVWPRNDWRQFKAMGNSREWTLKVAQPVHDFIQQVHDSGLVEIRWHTTWQHAAQNVARELVLPEFPVHEAPEYNSTAWTYSVQGLWWKLPAAWRVIAEEKRPLIWTDDDISFLTNKEQLAALKAAGKVLLIEPSSTEGLVKKHLTKIQEFIDLLQEESDACG
jgi:hypothetical protein